MQNFSELHKEPVVLPEGCVDQPILGWGRVLVFDSVSCRDEQWISAFLNIPEFEIRTVMRGNELFAGEQWEPDCLVLRLASLDEDAMSLLSTTIRSSCLPVLVVLNQVDEFSCVKALMVGADDCINLSTHAHELVARIYAMIRRNRRIQESATTIRVQDLEIDRNVYQLRQGARIVQLTRKEFEILAFLASPPGIVRTTEDILRVVWGRGHEHYVQTLRVHIANLRRKIDDAQRIPKYIGTVACTGYYLIKELT